MSDINVTGPDGSNFSFPAGTTQDVIDAALHQHYGTSPAGPQGQAAPGSASRLIGQGAQGFNDAVANTAGLLGDSIGWVEDRLTKGLGLPGRPKAAGAPLLSSEGLKGAADYVATLPGRVSDAVSQGSFSPLTDSRTSRFAPQGTAEKTAYGAGAGAGNALSLALPAGVIAKGAQAGTLTEGVANALAAQPALQAAAGATGGAVTGATDNPYLGLAASVAVPAGAAVVRKGVQGANALVQPFRNAGRDKIVGNVLADLADDPQTAIRNMEAYKPQVEGFKLSAAKAANDDSLMAAENAINKPGSGLGQQANANNAAITRALDKLDAGGDPRAFVAELAKQDAGAAMRAQAALDALPPSADAATAGLAIQSALRGKYDALIAARKGAADPLYTAARASSTPVNPWELMTSTADAVAANKGEPQAIMEKVRGLLFNPDGTPDRTARGMMATRDAVGAMLDNPQLDKYSRSLLLDVQKGVDRALSVVPEEQAAREAFAKASAPLEPFDARLGNRNVAATIAKDPYGKDFLAEPDTIPGRFFRPGDAGGASMRELLETKPSAEAKDAMYSYIGGKARESGNIGNFGDRYAPAINTLAPRLGQSLNEAATTNALASGYRASPAGRFVTGDADAAMRSTLGAPDSGRRLLSLKGAVAGNGEATMGMQKAIIDDFRAAARSKVAEDTTGNPRLVASGAERWLDANREAISKVLTPEQMDGLDAIGRALKDQSRSAVKVAGSDTGRNLATKSIVEGLLWKGAGESTLLSPIRKALGLVYGGANEKTEERLMEAMLDPKVAAALMQTATPEGVKAAVSSLGRLSLAIGVGSNVDTSENRLRVAR